MDAKLRKHLLIAAAVPIAVGLIAVLLTRSNDRIAFVEGPLPVFLFTGSLLVALLAVAAVTALAARPRAATEPPLARDSGSAERLEMLERLDSVVTGRLDAVGERLDRIGGPEAEAAKLEVRRLERFLADVHGVASLHDMVLDLGEVSPADVVSAAIRSASKAAGDRTIKADLQSPEPEPVEADRRMLVLALVNLIVNAVKFSRPDTPIVVRTTGDEQRVIFEVEDSGPGVPEGENVWTELVRGSNAGDTPGNGLGLPLVRLIAERHGGTAVLVSDPSGTVARITIPRP